MIDASRKRNKQAKNGPTHSARGRYHAQSWIICVAAVMLYFEWTLGCK